MGVDVRTGLRVSSIDDNGVDLDGSRIEARTVLWAAGVRASPIGESLGAPLDRTGRVLVRPDLSLPDHPEVFVVGDLAAMEQDGKPVPGVAQAALQGGRHSASSVMAGLDGRPAEPFRYKDKGMLAAIGRAEAVADLPHLDISGFVAWLMAIRICPPPACRSDVQWALAFVTHDRGARLITGPPATRGRWTEPRR